MGTSFRFAWATSMLLLGSGCEGVNEGPATLGPRPPPEAGPALSAAYVAQCARCHGERGEGTTITFPRLPGRARDEGSFIARVRGGGGPMPAFDESLISDADLKSDFAVLLQLNP
ncbi:MAG: cytochrome c [Labilithrix sp.]|nr:cytochrome c [Labilithrix sp.]